MLKSSAVAVGSEVCDHTLRQAVEAGLKASSYPAVRDVGFSVDSGKVALQGNVDSWHMKQQASETVRRVSGVRQICLANLQVNRA